MENEMTYIYTVYQCGSFSRAADKLYITQPALSIAVSKVESRIGMPIFDRTSKPLRLTKAGELYIRKYHEIHNLETELDQQLKDLSSLSTGSLRIGGSYYFCSHVLPPVISEFHRKYPGIRLELTETEADRLLQMIYDHDLDITFNCKENPKDSFIRIPCYSDTMLVSVPASFAAAKTFQELSLNSEDIINGRHLEPDTPAINLADLSDTPLIFMARGNDLYERCHSMFSQARATPDIILEAGQLVTAWHLSCAGVGAAFIPDYLISHHVDGIVFFKIDSPLAKRVFNIVMSDRHYISNAMSEFQRMMIDHFATSLRRSSH